MVIREGSSEIKCTRCKATFRKYAEYWEHYREHLEAMMY